MSERKANWQCWQRPQLPLGAGGPRRQHKEVKDARLQGTYCGQINLLFQVLFFFFPFIFLVSKSIFRESCFPHVTLGCCWAVLGLHCVRPVDFLVQRKAKPAPGLDAFWIFPPERSFTGINTGVEGKKNHQRVQILLNLRRVWCSAHGIAQTSQLWPQCCGCLVTLDTTFWKREEIPPNPLIYVLKPLLNLEKKTNSPHSRPSGPRLDTELGQRLPRVKHFQGILAQS